MKVKVDHKRNFPELFQRCRELGRQARWLSLSLPENHDFLSKTHLSISALAWLGAQIFDKTQPDLLDCCPEPQRRVI